MLSRKRARYRLTVCWLLIRRTAYSKMGCTVCKQIITSGQRISRITGKGQVTIPVEIRRLFGLSAHDQAVFLVEVGQVQMAPATLGVVASTVGAPRSHQPALTPPEEKA